MFLLRFRLCWLVSIISSFRLVAVFFKALFSFLFSFLFVFVACLKLLFFLFSFQVGLANCGLDSEMGSKFIDVIGSTY